MLNYCSMKHAVLLQYSVHHLF